MEGNVTPTAITRSSREGPGYNQSSKINYEFTLFLREINAFITKVVITQCENFMIFLSL